MDFVSDALFDGRRLRALTVVDQFTRECLAIRVDQNLRGEDVASVMSAIAAERGAPGSIRTDNGLPAESSGNATTGTLARIAGMRAIDILCSWRPALSARNPAHHSDRGPAWPNAA
jgi:transposase InsO family protein